MTLEEFVAARLDEDEKIARAAVVADGLWGIGGNISRRAESTVATERGRFEAPSPEDALHAAHHDPARVLREVAAKRAILGAYAKADEWVNVSAGATAAYARQIMDETLRAMAAVWQDHPDYRDEWPAVSGKARVGGMMRPGRER